MNYAEYGEQTSFDFSSNIGNHVWGDQLIKKEEEERKERERLRYEEYIKEKEREREERKRQLEILNKQKEEEFIEFYGCDMWQPGNNYPNIFVPLSVKRIPALDKVNFLEIWLGRNGKYDVVSTLVAPRDGLEPYTIDEYYEEFCTKTQKEEDEKDEEDEEDFKYIFTKKLEWHKGSVNYNKPS